MDSFVRGAVVRRTGTMGVGGDEDSERSVHRRPEGPERTGVVEDPGTGTLSVLCVYPEELETPARMGSGVDVEKRVRRRVGKRIFVPEIKKKKEFTKFINLFRRPSTVRFIYATGEKTLRSVRQPFT